jgi:succinylglutamate-semialdehyde dehydrogenase
MSLREGHGSFIAGRFVKHAGEIVASKNPAKSYEPIFSVSTSVDALGEAVEAARKAYPAWSALPQATRTEALMRFKESLVKREAELASAITSEMGKIYSESLQEVKTCQTRIDLIASVGLSKVKGEQLKSAQGESRYHAQGVLGVIAPYNFPAHLANAHIVPALMLGNTVVLKPSELCPWTAELYAQCMAEAGLPNGVFNMVQGGGHVGKALVDRPEVDGILFTGSYETGRAILENTIGQPGKIVALEMGGKNIAIVLDDADLWQAAVEVVQGAFLTTGQRCTATSRLFVQRGIADRFINALTQITRYLKPGDPMLPSTPFGPLATQAAQKHFLAQIAHAEREGAETLVKGEAIPGGAFVTPSLHLLKNGRSSLSGYTDKELFGPDLCIEIIDGLDDAIERVNTSDFGLANAIFTSRKDNFERFYMQTKAGIVNWNKSTNGASGELPFGGLGKSGNQRPSGIEAVRYATYPAAVHTSDVGISEPMPTFNNAFAGSKETLKQSVDELASRHKLEWKFENYGLGCSAARHNAIALSLTRLEGLRYQGEKLTGECAVQLFAPHATLDGEALLITLPPPSSQNTFFSDMTKRLEDICAQNRSSLRTSKPLAINNPKDGRMPLSESYLRRLYQGDFVPKEKKTPVIDLQTSKGPYLASIDDDPLVIFDAASQIATVGTGFAPDIYQRMLDEGELDDLIVANPDCTAHSVLATAAGEGRGNSQASELLHELKGLISPLCHPDLKHLTFTSAGAEANEKAFDLCRQNGPGGTRIIAFEGSFHGRTLMALAATYNPEKRSMFEFEGHEVTFVPFPKNLDTTHEPEITATWIRDWSSASVPPTDGSALMNVEVASLLAVKQEIEKGNVCAVIVEPVQCEGGDNFASARFFNGLRALTRGLGVPLIFDEVQTGFCLFGPFFAHTAFNLKDANGHPDAPDCVTLAKKAQLGVVLSRWEDTRPQAPHVVQIARGIAHAKTMLAFDAAPLSKAVWEKLSDLQERFTNLVSNIRCKGYGFAFDLPTKNVALQLVEQRFFRGFMVYIAGEKTLRFRTNAATTSDELNSLFDGLAVALSTVLRYMQRNPELSFTKALETFRSPPWDQTPILHSMSLQKSQPNVATTTLEPKHLRIETMTLNDFEHFQNRIDMLEKAAYEPGRQDNLATLKDWLLREGGLGLMVTGSEGQSKELYGFAIGGPVESSPVDGPKQDPMNGKHNTFYSANVLIAPEVRGLGIGQKLKAAQVDHVMHMRRQDGSHRYDYLTGRNRVGFTPEISRINRSFGAYTVAVHKGQYGAPDGEADYYRIPLRRPKLMRKPAAQTKQVGTNDGILEWGFGMQAPFGLSSNVLRAQLEQGFLNTAFLTKLTLSNFTTPDVVRYAELFRELMPKHLKHTYFTSGQSEVADKGIRCLRVNRPKGQVVIGFTGQYVGHCTAAARSVSDMSAFNQPAGWFSWPKVNHPTAVGLNASMAELERAIDAASPERVLGVVVELVGELSGQVASNEWLLALDALRTKTGIPLVFVESASGLAKNGESLFLTDQLDVQPNMVWWYAGSQHGHVMVDDATYISKPLTFISTWDGDELSIRRTYLHLLAARSLLSSGVLTQNKGIIDSFAQTVQARGRGYWWALDFKENSKATAFLDRALDAGLRLRKGLNGRVIICPPLNATPDDLNEGLSRIRKLL